MVTLNLETKSEAQKRLKAYLEQNASEILADKINNGVYIEKDGKRLLNKKNLNGFIKYATEEAKKQAAKGETGACVEDIVVFGWLIHYYEENDIIGTLYNEDGTEYKPTPAKCRKVETAIKTTVTPHKPAPKPQLNIFDMLTGEPTENSDNSSILPPQSQNSPKTEKQPEKVIVPVISADKPKKQPTAFYQTYLKLIEKYKGSLILLRLGDFYEAFNDHATTLASELNLTLTGRDCGLADRVPMVGIPFHAVYDYINKIIERGYKVILAEKLDEVLEFKDIDEYEEPEELSEEEMREFDCYVDEDSDELPTVSKIVGQTDDNENDESCTEILNAESAKAFEQNALCIIYNLFDNEITLA